MFSLIVLLTFVVPTAAPAFDGGLRLADWGSEPSRGVLVNLTVGARWGDPIDARRPTIVVVHGTNPFDPIMHFTMAERYAEAIGGRYGSTVNVLGWKWNADTMSRPLRPRQNQLHAVDQGPILAAALRYAGVEPTRLHLIGQSSGCLVAASAARAFTSSGRPPARLTLLDPAAIYHDLLFEALGAGTAARQVENYWSASLSGYGRPAPYPGVQNTRIDRASGALGLVRPLHSDHLNLVRWHIGRMAR